LGTIKISLNPEDAMCKDAVPCILHCENRCREKITSLMLIEHMDEKDGDPQAQWQLLTDVEQLINSSCFESAESLVQWCLPTTRNGKEIGCFLFFKLESLLSDGGICWDCLHMHLRRTATARFVDIITKYNYMMKLARQRHDFSDNEIDTFQKAVDDFLYHGFV